MSLSDVLPPSAGWCAWDRDECTVTIALDNEDEMFALVHSLPTRNRVRLVDDDGIMAVSDSANFYPELDAPDEYDGTTITWTFQLPKSVAVGAGVYRLEFVRSLKQEELLGNPVLKASGMEARSGETGTGSTEGDSPTAATSGGDARKDHP